MATNIFITLSKNSRLLVCFPLIPCTSPDSIPLCLCVVEQFFMLSDDLQNDSLRNYSTQFLS